MIAMLRHGAAGGHHPLLVQTYSKRPDLGLSARCCGVLPLLGNPTLSHCFLFVSPLVRESASSGVLSRLPPVDLLPRLQSFTIFSSLIPLSL